MYILAHEIKYCRFTPSVAVTLSSHTLGSVQLGPSDLTSVDGKVNAIGPQANRHMHANTQIHISLVI